MTTNIPAAEPESRFLGCVWLGSELGEHRLTEKGGIHFHDTLEGGAISLAFRSIDDLDTVIGELSAARYKVATQLLARRHYAHPELVNMGRVDDERDDEVSA